MPFWRGGFRPGVARVTIANLFSAEDLKTLSVDEINQRIDRRLGGAETKPPKRPFRVAAPRKLCEGLENILYYCPNCQGLYTLETKKNSLRCTACGTVAKMKRDARIVTKQGPAFPETVQIWFKQQIERELTFMQGEMEPLVIAVIVRMSLSPGNGMEPCGEGVLRLDSSGWRYEGDLKGENVALFFPLDTVPAIPFDPYYNIQIYAGGDMYMFVPKENLKACVQYSIIGECAYRRYATNMQMTQGNCFPDLQGRQTD
jgi:DNA-directed RNA polymerase subunit RPC12/RpoP